MSFERPILSAGARQSRSWAIGALLFALVTTTLRFGQFLANCWDAVHFPWQLDYGEGIVWEQMRLMQAGRGYGPIDHLPAIVFHYPPMFHMLTAAISEITGLDPLAAGRSVSIGSTLLIGLLAGLIAAKVVRSNASSRTAAGCGLVAGLTIFCFSPITLWAPLMRVDMLSVAFSFAGLLAAMAALTKRNVIFASALLFVAAVFTKQTAIAAPAAVFLTYLLVRPRLAWLLAATCLATGLVVLGALGFITDGGFVRHILLYNVNRFESYRLELIAVVILSHPLFAVVVISGVCACLRTSVPAYRQAGSIVVLRHRLNAANGDTLLLMVLVYAVLAGLMTLTVAKSGSSVNYFVEWLAVIAILLGIAVREATNLALGTSGTSGLPLLGKPVLLPMLIGIQALLATPQVSQALHPSPERIAELKKLLAMVGSAQGPVSSDDMVLLRRAGAPVQWEPAIFAELASTGVWDQSQFVQCVRARHFAFFITNGVRGERLFDSRYNPPVAAAMEAAYPLQQTLAGYTLHLPTKSLGRQPCMAARETQHPSL